MYEITKNNFSDGDNSIHDKDQILTVDLDGFNGPLDLLLNLAQSKKLDITKISILDLVDQYLEFIKKIKKLNLDLASDYLVMAAILAYIKSKLLIPEEDSLDNKAEKLPEILEFNLKRLKAMRENAERLFKKDLLYSKRFLRGQIPDKSIFLEKEYYCSKKNLIVCFANIFNRKSLSPITIKTGNYYSIDLAIKKIREIYKFFTSWSNIENCLPSIEEIGEDKDSFRMAFISTVAASLELVKSGEIFIKQNKEFGDIFVKKRLENE